MATRLILKGRVQGVFCRRYCSRYGRELHIRGSATNLRNGSVQVILNTEDSSLVDLYIHSIKNNTMNLSFFGEIHSVEKEPYGGTFRGDYEF